MNVKSATLTLRNIDCVFHDRVERNTKTYSIKNSVEDIDFDGGNCWLYPALWNAHEHLEFNLYPRIGNPPYPNAYEWGLEITQRKRDPIINKILSIPESTRYLWGALKNLLSATPYVLHHGETPDYLFEDDFPVTVIPKHSSPHSLRFEKKLREKMGEGEIRTIHIAEGTDQEASYELESFREQNHLTPRTGIVHGVGLTSADIESMKASRSVFIWCPSSNEFLFHQHAPIKAILNAGIPVMLGTDSTLTGSDGMFSEIRLASKVLTDTKALFRITGSTLQSWVSNFFLPASESFFMVRKKSDNPFEDFISIERKDVLLFVHDEQIQVCDTEFVPQIAEPSTMILVDGIKKVVRGEWEPIIHTIRLSLNESHLQSVQLT